MWLSIMYWDCAQIKEYMIESLKILEKTHKVMVSSLYVLWAMVLQWMRGGIIHNLVKILSGCTE